jgi:hypothetical protein
MVLLGYMLPTDKEHESKINDLSKIHEMNVEQIINLLIDRAYKEGF